MKRILTKLEEGLCYYLRQWHKTQDPGYNEYDDSAKVLVTIHCVNSTFRNVLTQLFMRRVFNYSKNCSAHTALATSDPWEPWALVAQDQFQE